MAFYILVYYICTKVEDDLCFLFLASSITQLRNNHWLISACLVIYVHICNTTCGLYLLQAFSGAVVERDVTNTAPVAAVPSGHLERTSDQEQVINMEPHTDKSPQPISTSRKQRVQQDADSDSQQLMNTGAQVQPKCVSKFRAQRMQQQDIGSDSQQSTDTETQVKPKRVSKFRAQRMQQEAKR